MGAALPVGALTELAPTLRPVAFAAFSIWTAVLFVVPAAVVAPSHRVAAATGAGVLMLCAGLWMAMTRELIGLLIIGASLGAVMLVVQQAQHGDRLADWPMLRFAYGPYRVVGLGFLSLVIVFSLANLDLVP